MVICHHGGMAENETEADGVQKVGERVDSINGLMLPSELLCLKLSGQTC